jgi:hypothetical protein
VGWKLDQKVEKTWLDVTITPRPGTATAKQIALAEQFRGKFGGFTLAGAAMTASVGSPVPPEKVAVANDLLDFLREKGFKEIEKQHTGDEAKAFKQIWQDTTEVVRKTIKSARVDAAVAVRIRPDDLVIVAGGHVADPVLLEKTLKDLAEAAKKDSPKDSVELKFDAEKWENIRFHTATIPLSAKDKEEEYARLVGDKIELVVGIDADSVYVGMGRDALKALKEAISALRTSSAKHPPAKFSLALEPIMAITAVADKSKDREAAAAMAAELKKTPGADHVNVIVTTAPRQSLRYRVEVEPGVLKAFGRMVVQQMEKAEKAEME